MVTVMWMLSARETRRPGRGLWLVMMEVDRTGGGAMVGGMAGSGGVAFDGSSGVSSGTAGASWAVGSAMCRPAELRRDWAVATVRPTMEGMT